MRAVLLLVLVPVALFLLLCGFLAVLLHLVPSLIHVLPWAGIVIVFGGAFAMIAWMGGIWGGSTKHRLDIER